MGYPPIINRDQIMTMHAPAVSHRFRSEQYCSLNAEPVFSSLSREEMCLLSGTTVCREYQRGEFLFRDGDDPAGVYYLYQGAVKIFKNARNGRDQIVRLAHAGSFLGQQALLSGIPHSHCAAALDRARAVYIPRTTFFSLVQTSRLLANAILEHLASDLSDTENQVVALARNSVRERVAEALLRLAGMFGYERDGITLRARISRGDVADIVGAATESVIRHLTDLRMAGVIALRGRRIGILRPDELQRIANSVV